MKLKAAVTNGTPQCVIDMLSSGQFAMGFLVYVAERALGAVDTRQRPAEYYVQMPDLTVSTGKFGIEVRLTGVSRGSRTPEQFNCALEALHGLVSESVAEALRQAKSNESVQIFCVIMIDGDVPLPEDNGYANMIEHKAVWVNSQGEFERTFDD